LKTQNTPALPTVIYDGDCGFCRFWIERWKQPTQGRVDYAPFQEAADRFPEIPREEFERSVQLITPQGEVFRGAEAVFRTLALAPGLGSMLWIYRNLPGAAWLSERVYGWIAGHRAFASQLTRLLWGKRPEPPSHVLVRSVFLRFLGVIYLIAFLSLWRQLPGLVGSQGILPAAEFLARIRSVLEGPGRYWFFPTLAWLDSSDGFLQFLALGGAAASLFAIAGVAPLPVLAILWLFYLSLATIGGVFLRFQWDALLLETGFLAILFAPGRLRPNLAREAQPSRLVLWLLRLLLFRLIFCSGAAKLLSGDPTWRHLSALSFHYETQPLPTPLAWYAHQLPLWFQKSSAAAMFFIELAVPWLIFSPRRLRFLAALVIVFLQVLIALTGNYAFFNLLTVALCLLLFDDQALRGWLPQKLGNKGQAAGSTSESRVRRAVVAVIGLPLLLAGLVQPLLLFWQTKPLWSAAQLLGLLQPLQVVNHYGLFSVMTTSRPEIVIEGSNDANNWQAYEFRYKPGDLSRSPPWVAPHQPRLDWQLWFAALGDYQQNPWFANLMARLLQGSPPVLALLGKNPFPGNPPRYLRAWVYEYHFSGPAARRSRGVWWQRESKGLYFPPVTLRR